MKKRFAVFTLLVGLFFLPSVSAAKSLWGDESSSFFSTYRSLKVGDIVTVIVSESTSALSKAGTDTKAADTLAAQLTNNIASLSRIGIGSGTFNLAGQGSNRYEGSGKTVRTSNVTAKVASRVTELLPNGNLRIEGFHTVAVNDEIQTVAIKGVIRSKDVSQQNSVQSWQVADAEVKVIGTGIVAEAEQPGWFTRIMNWLF